MYCLEIPNVLHCHENLDFWELLYENYLWLTLVEMYSIQ